MKKILVTGCSGLIGSEVSLYLSKRGYEIHGVDNNQRKVFFGDKGDTSWRLKELKNEMKNFHHYELDIRDREGVSELIKSIKPFAVVHTAAQPSHDRAASIPYDDFDTNAVGTLNLIESVRQHCIDSIFVHMSTNKVYGDSPNNLKLIEKEKRYDFASKKYSNGIAETFSIDHCKHSLFGASKVASDIVVQEYGRYFDMKTCCLRGGCLTGPSHSGVELHGFLNYLIQCHLQGNTYNVLGYKGKQVRDNIHSNDVASFIHEFIQNPRSAEVYNLGGGKNNSCSILEAFDICEGITGKKQKYVYKKDNRIGDHICYYSDLSRIKKHYPNWEMEYDLESLFKSIIENVRK